MALPVAVVLAAALGSGPAAAQPASPAPLAPPSDAAGVRAELERVQHEAEALTEQWHAAKDALGAREEELEARAAAVEPAREALDAALAEEEQYRRQVDDVVLATFRSGRLDQFSALLTSGSPQDFLDEMSALANLSGEHKVALDRLTEVVARTGAARAEADASAEQARVAADEARRAEEDLHARKRAADERIAQARRLLAQLSPAEVRELGGPDVAPPADVPPGSGVGARALQAAASQLGKPYVWGAEGPNAYDCSGLMYWAYRQAGVTLPRSSSQQATVGRAVAFSELRPGDLVFYYSPISHVGMYAGDGKMIDASTEGVPVKYSTVSAKHFATARRI